MRHGEPRLDKRPEIGDQLRCSSPGRPLGSRAETKVADLGLVGAGAGGDSGGASPPDPGREHDRRFVVRRIGKLDRKWIWARPPSALREGLESSDQVLRRYLAPIGVARTRDSRQNRSNYRLSLKQDSVQCGESALRRHLTVTPRPTTFRQVPRPSGDRRTNSPATTSAAIVRA
jgi:hypothetical protein